MKMYVLGFICLGLTNLMFAQNDIAALSATDKVMTTKTRSINNIDYLNTVNTSQQSVIVQKLQKMVADYNIKNDDVYNKNLHTTYTVEFTEGDNHITAIYNRKGELISCQENYNAIRLPATISSKLAQEYPGWAFAAVNCDIAYQQNTHSKIAYQVVLKKGKKSKTVNIKA